MSGSIPYFLDLDKMPAGTMTSFPRELIATAMKLPGVPSQAEVKESMHSGKVPPLNLAQFDTAAYAKIHEQLMKYAEKNLLSTSMAAKLVPSPDASHKVARVLILSIQDKVGYGAVLLGRRACEQRALCVCKA